ncbi:MAG TPA: glycosyltransferase [Methylococcaceae bacterium]|nr:glycosyltransferase [Methylococcaceae bacterium]
MEVLGLSWPAVAVTAVWLAILLVPWQPWRNREVLEAEPGAPEDLSDVTVLIPARDEAAVIGTTLAALAEQGENLQVVVVDDASSDGTGDIARNFAGLEITVVQSQPLQEGWSGKLWALEQGRRQVKTPLTLLLDADIQLRPGLIAAIRRQRREKNVAFLSLMASLRMENFWEKLLLPAFVYFFKLLYPFALANSSSRRFAAAAGGCILVDTRLLAEIGGFDAIRGALIDDCALAHAVKKAGYRTWMGLSRGVVSLRRQERLADVWNMVARTAFTQLRYSVALLFLCTGLMTVLFWLPLLGLFGDLGYAFAFAGMTLSFVPTLGFYGLSLFWALFLPLTAGLYLAMTWSSALRYWRGERSRWKGRVYR